MADKVKEATLEAVTKIIEPLLELMLDTGITVQELNQLARVEAVRIASKRLAQNAGRQSKSRVAILTGLPRSEVGRILNFHRSERRPKIRHHAGRRVLAGWHENSKYLGPDGVPAILPVFGKRRSFERLVSEYGNGIPVRAMLDELAQLKAVEVMANQQVRAISRVPILTGINSRTITAFGDRGKDLLTTLGHNLRASSQPLFESTSSTELTDPDMVTVVRREMLQQGANFINATNSMLSRAKLKSSKRRTKKSQAYRLGVTLYYFQDEVETPGPDYSDINTTKRRNLRRLVR